MKKGNLKRVIAGFMCMTLVFTSVFFLLLKTDVFGAGNKDDSSVKYVDEATASKLDVSLADKGSDKASYSYNEWDPNELVTDEEKTNILHGEKLPKIPAATGKKGSKTNPFVILEVVPDKAMQELTYYAGSEEEGLPYDPAYFSAKFMMEKRGTDNTYRFTNPKKEGQDRESFLNSLRSGIADKYANNIGLHKYDYFNFAGEGEGSSDNLGMYLLDCEKTDADKEDGFGSYNFKELYNIDVSEDDLLNSYPSSWTKPTLVANGEDYSYQETRSENITNITDNYTKIETNGKSKMYYTDDLIYLARVVLGANDQEKIPTKAQVQKFITDKLNGLRLDANPVKSTNKRSGYSYETTCKRSIAIKKYNLEWYVQSQRIWDYYGHTDSHGKNAQDVSNWDMFDDGNGEFDKDFQNYDISEGIFCATYLDKTAEPVDVNRWKYNRGLVYYHHTNDDMNISNYWKVRFRKYYIDRYEQLFNTYNLYNYLFLQKQSKQWNSATSKVEFYTDPTMESLFEILEFIYGETNGKTFKQLTDADVKSKYNVDKAAFEAAYRDYFKDYYKSLYNEFISIRPEKPDEWGNFIDHMKKDESQLVDLTSEKFRALTREYEPLFVRAGVTKEALQDTYDWEFTMRRDVSKERTYKSQPKGGYILAVKPGRGDMYLMSPSEVKSLYKERYSLTTENYERLFSSEESDVAYQTKFKKKYGLSDEEFNRIFGSDTPVVFTRNDIKPDGTVRDVREKRWTYVASEFGLEGYYPSGTERSGSNPGGVTYLSGYLDDRTYTNGFASKSFIDADNYWFALYDRGGNYSEPSAHKSWGEGGRRYSVAGTEGADTFDIKMLSKTNDKDYGDDSIYHNYKRTNNIKIDDFNLNIKNELDNDGVTYENYSEIFKSKDDDNLETLYSKRRSKELTGFCFNFNTYDVYNESFANQNALAKEHYKKVKDAGLNPDIPTVSANQAVCETQNVYHFTYYGFAPNPVLKRNLWKFKNEAAFEDFNMKVIAVTPAEMNLISKVAKRHNNETDPSKVIVHDIGTNQTGKDANKAAQNNVYIDLAERADMYYIHTDRIKSYNNLDNMEKLYGLYHDMVMQGAGSTPTRNGVKMFYDNDLEWDQCMKIIYRSSLSTGVSIPILYNQMVTQQSDECVDIDDDKTGNGAEDTHMYLYPNQESGKYKYSGNMCNISKLYDITIQFDLRMKPGFTIPKKETPDREGEKSEAQKYIGQTFTNKRTFMADIFKSIGQVKVDPSYNSTNKVPGTAEYTGYIWAENDPKAPSYQRKLCSAHTDDSTEFKRNTLYMWNMFTFYPFDIGKPLEDERLFFMQQGYLEKWFYSDELEDDNTTLKKNAQHKKTFMIDSGSNLEHYLWRVGSNGTDYQNVYVLHASDGNYANLNGSSFASGLSQGGQKGSSNIDVFFGRAYLIINSSMSESFEIKAEPRQKVYSLLKRASDPTENNTSDTLMYDYFRGKNKPVKYDEIDIDKRIDVLVSSFVSTDLDEAVITKIRLVNSSKVNKDGSEAKDIVFLGGNKEAGEGEVKSGLKVKRYENIKAYENDVKKSGDSTYDYEWRNAVLESGKGKEGYCVSASGGRVYFYVPYTLGQFYDGYDKIVFDATYYETDKKSGSKIPREYTHEIDITERDLFALE